MAYDYELRRRMIGFAGFLVLVGGMVYWGTSDLHKVMIGRMSPPDEAIEKQASEASAIALSSLRMAGTTATKESRSGEGKDDEGVAAK